MGAGDQDREPDDARRRLAELGALTRELVYRLNNPLTVLRGQHDVLRELLEAAEASGTPAADWREHFGAATASLNDMVGIIGALGQYAREDSEPGPVELAECAMMAYAVASVKLRYAAELDLEQPTQPLVTWGVRERLQQLLVGTYLHIGSREASYGRIEVRFEQDEPDTLGVVIRDLRGREGVPVRVDGHGLDPGAGLAVARHIAEQHGGVLTQTADSEGRATHRLTLPRVAP